MKYRGFREETLLAAYKDIESIGLRPPEIHAILNLAGAKWRTVQIREGRGDEFQAEADSRVFHEATLMVMRNTMVENQKLALLGHASEGERFMLLAISVAMSGLFSRGPDVVREWLRSGDRKTKRIVLSFAVGSSIVVEPSAIDILVQRVVKSRYGVVLDADSDKSDSIIEIIDRLGNSGYSCLKPITDITI